MKQNLNTRFIKSLKCTGEVYEFYDKKIHGFSVRMHRKGSISFSLRYTHAGKRKRYTLCKYYPGTRMDEVRELAASLSLKVSQGIDIQAERQQKLREDRQNMTVKELCEEYMKDGCKHKAMSTQYIDNIRINCHIIPTIGKKRLSDLTKTNVTNMRIAIESGETAKYAERINPKSKVKGGPVVADDSVKLVGLILNYATAHKYITDNPASKIERFRKSKKPGVFYSNDDYASISKEMEGEENTYGEKAVNIVTLLALTGCRRTEIESLRWDDIDLENKRIELKHTKTGERTVYLATPVVELLKKLKPSRKQRFVFPSDRKNTYYKNTSQKWRLMREKAGIVKPNRRCVLHDFRYSFCSVANELGYPRQTIGALVGHSEGSSTTAGYIILTDEYLIQTADIIANAISKKMQGQKIAPIYTPVGKRIFLSATEGADNITGDKLRSQNLKKTVPTYDLDSAIKQLGHKDGLIANETVSYVVDESALNTARTDADFKASEEGRA